MQYKKTNIIHLLVCFIQYLILVKCFHLCYDTDEVIIMAQDILFDLDGTISDSADGIINCSIKTLQHFGITPPSRQEMRSFIGPPAPYNFRRMGIPEAQIEDAVRIYRSHYRQTGIYENYMYPGIAPLLRKLNASGRRLFVATSKPEHLTVPILERFGIADCFALICGAASDTERNSKEAVIAHLLHLAGGLTDAVMVGDTVFDVKGAAQFGIPTICVSWGYGDSEILQQAGAVAIVHNTEELYEILTK